MANIFSFDWVKTYIRLIDRHGRKATVYRDSWDDWVFRGIDFSSKDDYGFNGVTFVGDIEVINGKIYHKVSSLMDVFERILLRKVKKYGPFNPICYFYCLDDEKYYEDDNHDFDMYVKNVCALINRMTNELHKNIKSISLLDDKLHQYKLGDSNLVSIILQMDPHFYIDSEQRTFFNMLFERDLGNKLVEEVEKLQQLIAAYNVSVSV